MKKRWKKLTRKILKGTTGPEEAQHFLFKWKERMEMEEQNEAIERLTDYCDAIDEYSPCRKSQDGPGSMFYCGLTSDEGYVSPADRRGE